MLSLRTRILLTLGFFAVGIFGRFPWKADEPYSFGAVWDIVQHGHWLVPDIAGQPFVEKPPLVYWLGAISTWPLSSVPAHESSRFAIIVLVGLTLFALWRSARTLWFEAAQWRRDGDQQPHAAASPQTYAWSALLLFAATVGVAEHIHRLTADLGQLAGSAIALSGLVELYADCGADAAARRPGTARAGVWIGTGLGVAFMSKGLLVPGVVALTWLGCHLMVRDRRASARKPLAFAALAALPWLAIWPAMLWSASPPLFHEWFWDNNIGRFEGLGTLGATGATITEKMASIAAVTFPALPLAVATAVRAPRWQRVPGHVCAALFSLVSLGTLVLSGTYRDNYALPLIMALALVGQPAASALTASDGRFMKRVIDILFAAAAVTVATVWLQLLVFGVLWPAPLHDAAARVVPLPFHLPANALSVAIALLALAGWLRLIRDGQANVVESWCSGFAMLWILFMALLLPWIDAARSYERTFSQLGSHVRGARCLATSELGESESAMLEYVTGLAAAPLRLHERSNPAAVACDWLVEQSRTAALPTANCAWTLVWQGSRPAEVGVRFNLYRRSTGGCIPPRIPDVERSPSMPM